MNEFQLRTTEMFGEVKTDIYENEEHEMFMTARQLGECLGYKSKSGIDSLISRNPRLKEEEFSGTCILQVPQGNGYSMQETRVFNEDGIYEVTFLADTDKALEFHHWVRRLLKSLRKGDLQLTNGNVTFSQEMFEAVLSKYLTPIENRVIALENKKPAYPNFWLWKKHVSRPLIHSIVCAYQIDTRDAYDMVYDYMYTAYGFDRSDVISQLCNKYELPEELAEEGVSVIDAIADSPVYQREFTEAVHKLADKVSKNNSEVGSLAYDDDNLDKVQKVIFPLMRKYNDLSPNGSATYRIVYNLMDKPRKVWRNMLTRYHCKSKKELLLKYDKYFEEFVGVVNRLLNEEEE